MNPAFQRARTVLVVEDNPDHRDVLQRQLEALGVRVVVAADGLEGLAQLERCRPDAVLCDLAMPTMDGLEFATRVRRDGRFRHMLLLAVTGRATQADLVESWRVGFDGHVVKPVTAEVLNAITERLALTSRLRMRSGA
jgi:CheY-like chemotaxis protein